MGEEKNFDVEKMEAEGKLWEKGAYKRIYFNQRTIESIIGLEYSHYNSGNISGAWLNGEHISNCECRRILGAVENNKFFYDMKKEEFASNWENKSWYVSWIIGELETYFTKKEAA